MNEQLPPLEDLTGDLFVNRNYELDTFWQWATNIPHRPHNSYALIGRRRTGKTAILVKLFNRLFYKQEKVVPVFISFAHYLNRKQPINMYDFAREYFTGYIASYLAFQHRKPNLLATSSHLTNLKQSAHQLKDDYVLNLFADYEAALEAPTPYDVAQWAINFPRGMARIHNIPTAIIVDEFQILTNAYDPIQKTHYNLTQGFQWAVETQWAPLLVSGSSVSLLVGEALGGMLSGRFKYHHLQPLNRQYTHDLVFRIAQLSKTSVNEALAEAIWQLTRGYPHAIDKLMNSECPARQNLPSLKTLADVLHFELTNINGELRQHYHEEFEKYSTELNDGQTTRRVMFWATKYPNQRIDAEQVAQEIGADLQTVHQSLDKLHWADIVYKTGLSSYQGPSDPMLRRFIEYQHYTEIEKLSPTEAVKDWHQEYKQLQGKMNNFMGEVAEMYIHNLMAAFDKQEVEGQTYFNQKQTIILPKFDTIERRGGIVKAGIPIEIDLIGECTNDNFNTQQNKNVWLVQVRFTKKPTAKSAIEKFLNQTDTFINKKDYHTVTRWYFCKQGFTTEASNLLEKHQVLFSNRANFNALAKLFGFFGLPK